MSSPKGLKYIKDFISPQEEMKLLHAIKSISWQEVKMHGKVAKRKVIHFGLDYEYDSRLLTATVAPPKFLKPLLKKSAFILKVKPQDLAEILISYYPIGAPIGWHRDAPPFDKILGVSLGSSCLIKFRNISESNKLSYQQILERRSAYILESDVRWNWQHHIPPVKEERFSITFRTLISPH